MPALLWTSVLLGVALGAANASASLLLARAARGRSQQAFLVIVFGGMAFRMVALLAAFTAIVAWAPIHRLAFTGALIATVVLGLGLEVILMARTLRPAPRA
ncbi:MAG TPA: hypothetical protein VK610_04795 [Rhodothermales bacterium]|nr:hypothetical protein [Rhodothermales bacterium]